MGAGRLNGQAYDAAANHRARFAFLAATTAILTVLQSTCVSAQALPPPPRAASPTSAGARSYAIPAGSLAAVINRFADVSQIQLVYSSETTRGLRTGGLNGTFTSQQALAQLLAGSGLTYRYSGANTVTIERPGAAAALGEASVDGALMLDTVNVSGGRVSAADAPYQTPGPVSHISSETIDRFRGSSPADMFRGTPGVLSGEARNGAGGIDVNVRGMQGMGRVNVTVDGAENNMTVYQGYQGVSNRTFVDPDLLAGIDITKGSDASSRGIAGTVAMRTLNAGDVVKPGEKWGVWLKGGFSGNTAEPRPGALGGYLWQQPQLSNPNVFPNAKSSGFDRPGGLMPTSGSGSAVAAWNEKNFDVLAGYAHRQQGNYFAGTRGPGAEPVGTGIRAYCTTAGVCRPLNNILTYTNWFENAGISSYRLGEEVLNTQLDTESWIAKATLKSNNDQTLQFGYTGIRSEAGDLFASQFATEQSQATQQARTAGTQVNSGTMRYRWNPADNGLFDLKANLWMTDLKLRNPIRGGTAAYKPEELGLGYDYRTGNNAKMWGGDITNKSHLSFDRFGSVDLTYGISYLREATQPAPYNDEINGIPSRNGKKNETAAFGKVAYKPVEWLTLNGGLRYAQFHSLDMAIPVTSFQVNPQQAREGGGYSPSAGITVEPIKGTQLYVNYSNTMRMPSLIELSSAYTMIVNQYVRPERSSNWEAGVNVIRDGVFAASDKTMLKFGYFNWDIQDYVARAYRSFQGPGYVYTGLEIYNIDRAKFEGLEFSGRYEYNGFTAELAASYYLNVEFCKTADTCDNKTLSSDYATNQVPPKYSGNLTLSQKLFDDTLTVGGRASYTGARAAGHGVPVQGLQALIAVVNWQPYWLFDAFAEYKLTKDITAWARVENITDLYYVDPLSLVVQPGPGRTFSFGLTGKFGGEETPAVSIANLFDTTKRSASWTGFYVGGHAAYSSAELNGTMTTVTGPARGNIGAEAPNLDLTGFLFGVHVGFDYQFASRIVAGLEIDLAKSEISGSQVTYAIEGSTCACGDNMLRQRMFESVQKTEFGWLATVRGRLGYAVNDRLMVYGTAGAAFLQQDQERTQYIGAQPAPPAVTQTVADFTETASMTRVGYAIGGGAHFAIGEHWALKAEYLLARFAEKEMVFANAKSGVMIPNFFGYPVTSTTVTGRKLMSRVDVPMLKLGLNYRF